MTVGAEPRPPGSRRALVTAVVVLLVALGTTVQLAREAAVSAWDTIWAEDGSIFLADALNGSPLEKVVTPYGGYIHVLPRLVGGLVAVLPLERAALLFALAAFTTVSLLAAFVYYASSSTIESVPLRLALSTLVVLLPAEGSELLGNVTNIHFYLMYGCFWAFVWRSDSTAAITSRSLVVAATALGDVLAAIYLPLALWNAMKRRTRRDLAVPIALLSGLAIQAIAILASGSPPHRGTRFNLDDVPTLFALRVTGSLFVGDRFIDDLWFQFGRWFSYGTLALVAALVAVALVRLDIRRKIFVALCAGYAITLFFAYLYGRGSAGMRPGYNAATWHLAGARFTLVPILLLATALLVFADTGVKGRATRYARGLALIFVVALVVANFSFKSERSLGPRWEPELAAARSRCANSNSTPIRILVAPAPFDFFVSSRCDRIR
jgi:hypothetical protein